MGLFGGGNSSSSQSTTSLDGRVVGADGSINSSLNVIGSGNTVMTTDGGAVSASMELATKGIEGAQQIAREAQAGSNELMAGIFHDSASQASKLTQAVVELKTSETKTLVVTGMAVVAIVVAVVFKRKAAA